MLSSSEAAEVSEQDKRYEIIYGDFPWPYTSCGTAALPYEDMWDVHGNEYPRD